MDLVSDPRALVVSGAEELVPGRYYWLTGGRVLPMIAGAEEDDDDDLPGDGDGDKKGDDKGGDDKDQQTFSRDYVEALRQESAGYRSKLRSVEKDLGTLRQELEGLKGKDKTDDEKRQQELTETRQRAEAAEKRAQRVAVQAAVERAARKLDVIDEEVAFRLLDADKIEFDDDGKPINVEALLQELVKDKPFLVGEKQDGKRGVPPSPKGNNGKSDADALMKKTREELAATGKYTL